MLDSRSPSKPPHSTKNPPSYTTQHRLYYCYYCCCCCCYYYYYYSVLLLSYESWSKCSIIKVREGFFRPFGRVDITQNLSRYLRKVITVIENVIFLKHVHTYIIRPLQLASKRVLQAQNVPKSTAAGDLLIAMP